ncbi:MAG: peptidylprolyl isomerase [Armatimonadetes bacterium]|nr:peptidylprolyl isomerase [Armatimonadota bacterium]
MRRIFLIVLMGAVALPLSCLISQAQAEERIIATVNGQPITETQLRDQLLLRWGDRTIMDMMQELAIEQAAAEAGVSVTDAEVDRRVQDLQRSIDMKAPTTGQSFSLWLAQRKMTLYGLKVFMRGELLLEKMVKDQVQVTDQQVAEMWERSKDKWRRPEKMHVRHICVPTEEEAKQILEQLRNGADFATAAAEHSIDPYTKDSGGDWGWIAKGNQPFQKAAFALTEDGQLSEPVHTIKGWHIIQRVEYRPASTPNFEDVQEDIRRAMEQQRLLQLINTKRAEILRAARIKQELQPQDLVSTAGNEG